MKLSVLQGEHFSCHGCTNCCRNWHVELIDTEVDRIAHLKWPAGDRLDGATVQFRHSGKIFIAHRPDGSCIFLNESNGLCRIHEQFGVAAKPVGCRLFPFQITPTFPGEAAVIGRYDCPSILRNEGAAHADELPALRRLAGAIRLPAGFDESVCCHLERGQIEAVCEFVGTMLAGFEGNERKVLFIGYLCDGLAATMADDLDRGALARAYPILRDEVDAAMSASASPPGWIARMGYRTLLGMYLRRDEDVLDGRAGRLGRTLAMGATVLGYGNLRRLGLVHRPGKLHKARLFSRSEEAMGPEVFATFWRLVRTRLDSAAFMGAGNGGRNFLEGLRSLALLYPLMRGTAKCNAAARGAARVDVEDVDLAVAAIEHSFGRQAILNQASMRSIEKLLLDRHVFTRLVRTV